MHVFKHPKYYTELRKRNKSDQAISQVTTDKVLLTRTLQTIVLQRLVKSQHFSLSAQISEYI